LLIASWNVNSIRTRLNQVRKFLESSKTDILCLQETKVSDEDFPIKPFEAMGYKVKFSGQKSYNGVAIISKFDFQDFRVDFLGELKEDEVEKKYIEQKRIISALINDVRIINVYVPNGSSLDSEKFQYKLNWLKLLSNYLSKQSDRDELTCLLGDFNIAPTDEDIFNPDKYRGSIMASSYEREALKSIIKNKFIDSFRVFEKDSGFWTWWDYRNNSYELNKGWRIDHIYISNNLLMNLKSSVISRVQRENEQPSDHVPIIINLNLEELSGEYDNYDASLFEL
tara:strand:+ start:11443 stop:12288 length:846 start_codon:yes stop_codon:yes gene_type:complete